MGGLGGEASYRHVSVPEPALAHNLARPIIALSRRCATCNSGFIQNEVGRFLQLANRYGRAHTVLETFSLWERRACLPASR